MKAIRRGFTLVELMVALLLAGLVSIITFQLFDTTADVLGEIDSLAESTGQARFAMERMRIDFSMAGGLATPDSKRDIWVQPSPSPNGRFMALTGYENWQDNTTRNDADTGDLYTAENIGAATDPYVSADGLVVFGAYDFPLSFEVAGFTDVGVGTPQIQAHGRGLYKLYSPDPFRTDLAPPAGVDFETADIVDAISTNWSTRVLRISDRQGYMQFVGLGEMDAADHTASMAGAPAFVALDVLDNPVFKSAGTGSDYGLDVNPDGDTSYDSAVIDAFWYHVEQDPDRPGLTRLVRSRICARTAAVAAAINIEFKPWDHLPSTCGGTNEDIIIAERIADFQIWFDCGDPITGRVEDAVWDDNWIRPNHNNDAAHCMNVTDSTVYEPGLARFLNIRLTVHAEAERPGLAHSIFEDGLGNYGPDALLATPNTRLKTFDINPDLQGAAPVVTMQTSIELVNHSFRNATPGP